MEKRPFNLDALSDYANEELRAPLGVGALVWRYTIFVPLEERRPGDAEAITLADLDDIENLRSLLVKHFLGVTVLSPLVGAGLRAPDDPSSIELNSSLPFVVYARPIAASDSYFVKLQEELQEALDQGLVLVERQDVFLLGRYRSTVMKKLVALPSGQSLIEGHAP
jgi:hypothetical protein